MVSTHPRTRARLENLARKNLEGITFHEAFGYLDYNKLQLDAKCVISDSGTISEESSILKFPAVALRNSTERPEVLSSIVLSGLKFEDVLKAIEMVTAAKVTFDLPEGYSSFNFSESFMRFVFSTSPQHRFWRHLY